MLRTVKFAFTTARRSISRRRFRSALTILGIIVGISAMVSLMTLGYGMQHEVETALSEILGAAVVISSSGGGVGIPEYVGDLVLQIPGVNDSVPVIMTMVNIGDRPIMVIGIDPAQVTTLYHVTYEQEPPQEIGAHDAILGSGTATALGVGVNDTVTLGTQLGGVGETFVVVGTLRSIGSAQMNVGCFITLTAAQRLLDKSGYVSAILITLSNRDRIRQVEAAVKSMFPNAQVTQEEEIMRQMNRITNIINGVLIALSSVSLAIGGLGIMNTVMMSVHERRREIGMLKAVGAERWHVLLLFLSEALIISFIGGLLGCLCGLGGVYFIQYYVNMLGLNLTIPLHISPQILGVAVLAAMAIGVVAGFYPSWTAAKVRPVEALRYE